MERRGYLERHRMNPSLCNRLSDLHLNRPVLSKSPKDTKTASKPSTHFHLKKYTLKKWSPTKSKLNEKSH